MVIDLVLEIRFSFDHPWRRELLSKNWQNWNKVWKALDLIDDTQQAIDTYSELPDFSGTGGYLYIFGVMQALFVQQDATKSLYDACIEDNLKFTDFPRLDQIRKHRNESIGHPSDRGNGKSFHLIVRNSIEKEGFDLESRFTKDKEASKIEEISIIECIKNQREEIIQILKKIMERLESDFETHKKEFSGESLKGLIPDSYLFTTLRGDNEAFEVGLRHIKEAVDKIRTGITKRYESLEALPDENHLIQMMEYILQKLEEDLSGKTIDDKKILSSDKKIDYFSNSQKNTIAKVLLPRYCFAMFGVRTLQHHE